MKHISLKVFTHTDVECFCVHIPHRNISGSEYFHREYQYQSSPFISWDKDWCFSWTSGACKEASNLWWRLHRTNILAFCHSGPKSTGISECSSSGNQTAALEKLGDNIDVMKGISCILLGHSFSRCSHSLILAPLNSTPRWISLSFFFSPNTWMLLVALTSRGQQQSDVRGAKKPVEQVSTSSDLLTGLLTDWTMFEVWARVAACPARSVPP